MNVINTKVDWPSLKSDALYLSMMSPVIPTAIKQSINITPPYLNTELAASFPGKEIFVETGGGQGQSVYKHVLQSARQMGKSTMVKEALALKCDERRYFGIDPATKPDSSEFVTWYLNGKAVATGNSVTAEDLTGYKTIKGYERVNVTLPEGHQSVTFDDIAMCKLDDKGNTQHLLDTQPSAPPEATTPYEFSWLGKMANMEQQLGCVQQRVKLRGDEM